MVFRNRTLPGWNAVQVDRQKEKKRNEKPKTENSFSMDYAFHGDIQPIHQRIHLFHTHTHTHTHTRRAFERVRMEIFFYGAVVPSAAAL